MCELCSDDPAVRKMALEGHSMFANRLRRLASFYDNVADRKIKPHTEVWKDQHDNMRFVAKEFLEILL